jgi:hypothetical protein
MPLSELVSNSSDWQTAKGDEHKPECLFVQLRRGAFVFPWMRFVVAEGENTKIHIVFATHEVIIKGQGLSALLTAVSSQRVIRVIEPSQSEATFGVRGSATAKHDGPGIESIAVKDLSEKE